MIRRILLLALCVAAIAAMGAGSLSAHHSYSSFDRDQTVSIDGRLEKFDFVNPHVLMTIKTDSETYIAEWLNVSGLQRAGVTRETLKVGDRIVVSGSPKRNPAEHIISLVKEVRRPADGWSWPPNPR